MRIHIPKTLYLCLKRAWRGLLSERSGRTLQFTPSPSQHSVQASPAHAWTFIARSARSCCLRCLRTVRPLGSATRSLTEKRKPRMGTRRRLGPTGTATTPHGSASTQARCCSPTHALIQIREGTASLLQFTRWHQRCSGETGHCKCTMPVFPSLDRLGGLDDACVYLLSRDSLCVCGQATSRTFNAAA